MGLKITDDKVTAGQIHGLLEQDFNNNSNKLNNPDHLTGREVRSRERVGNNNNRGGSASEATRSNRSNRSNKNPSHPNNPGPIVPPGLSEGARVELYRLALRNISIRHKHQRIRSVINH